MKDDAMGVFTLPKFFRWVFERALFNPCDAIENKTAIPYIHVPGDKGSRMVLVLGDNAAGKSLFRRMFRIATYKDRQGFDKPGPLAMEEVIHLSMQGRTMEGMHRVFQYGDESYESTGRISAHGVEGAIKTALGREHEVAVYWDEPDMGMSSACSAGIGVTLREFSDSLPEHKHIKAVMVTTHGPFLVQELLKAKHRPHYIYLGNPDGPKTLEDWITAQTTGIVPILPEALGELAHTRFRTIQSVLNAGKKAGAKQ